MLTCGQIGNRLFYGTAKRVKSLLIGGKLRAVSATKLLADQGPGIPSEDIDKLFGTFQKLSVQPTAGEKSTGLGLSIVKQIVNAHGGEITVDSKVGKGSVFTVRIPVEPVS